MADPLPARARARVQEEVRPTKLIAEPPKVGLKTGKRAAGASRITQIKLYNSGSFFDQRAIPVADHFAIADRVCPFERVIVECHPALVNDSAVRFRDLLSSAASLSQSVTTTKPQLEVALGLETVHPQVLPRLNKRMTLRDFSRAAGFLRRHDIALRVFVLVQPPFLDPAESLEWTKRSLEFAFDCGATVTSLIPTRGGNGALELLQQRGEFTPPRLEILESALACGIDLKRGRVFADLWDLDRFAECPDCYPARAERLREMNLRQIITPPIRCARCGRG